MKSVGIIGSGFGGLSAAIYLAKAGYEVTIYEKHDQAGGRARVLQKDGFRRDMGPSRYLMPDIFEQTYRDWGYDIHQELDLSRLDPSYRVHWVDDNVSETIATDRSQNKDFFEQQETGSYDRIQQFLKKTATRYTITIKDLLYKPYKTLLSIAQKLVPALKINTFGSLRKEIKNYISNPKIQSILEYTMIFIGTNPQNAPGMYSIMAHVDAGLGVRYPQGGMTSIITSLVGIAKEAGVIFKYNHPVQQILIDSKNKKPQATGLIIDGKIHHHDIVISNADLPFTETQLIKEPRHQTYPLSYWKRKELAPSTFLIYLGVSGKVPELLHHNLFFRKDRDAGFDKIFGNHHTQLPQDPNIYVCCPSASDDSVAPEGDTNIFVLVPTPVHVYPDEQTRKSYAAEIISMIESSLDISIADRIVSQTIFDANEFVSEYHSFGGTALGLAHTLDQSAYWRPYIQSKKVSNLYYSGGWTQPGIGMPMCLLSGKYVADDISKKRCS